jgi:predicted dehydrogenase
MANEQQTANVSRRDVIKAAGAVTAVAAAAKIEGFPAIRTVHAADNQVQYGFIGPGSRGQHLMNFLTKTDEGRCVAVCDTYEPNLDKGAELIGTNPAKYKDYRELLARQDVEAVFIATPLYTHFPVMRDALLAGKHVFCEKSLVFRPEEVHALRALHAERPRQVIQTGLQRRYSRFYQLAKDMIDKGVLGTVTHVRAQWHRNTDWRRPVKDPALERQLNWRMYREYSGGLTAELCSHQLDVADWMFGAHPEFVTGVGGIDFWKDGRDIYDNIQLIYAYTGGQKLIYSSITTNAYLSFDETIMGTEGTIVITVGPPGRAMWYREPNPPKFGKAGTAKENWTAGATAMEVASKQGLPLVLPEDLPSDKDNFLARELKFARQWLYRKGVMVPEEEVDPVYTELESFLKCCRTGARPLADIEVGLMDSIGVILGNLAMDEGRRVYYKEMDTLGKGRA